MRNVHPVEELFEIRAEMRALKAREAELRTFFVERAGPAERIGPFHEVTVRRETERVFQADRLPRSLRADPALWDIRPRAQVAVARRAEPELCAGFAEAPDRVRWVDFDPAWMDDPLIDELDRFDA